MPKKYQQSYTQDDLERAVRLVKEEGVSVRKAANHYKIPRSTLNDRVSGRIEMGAKPGRKQALPIKIEEQIVEKTLQSAEAGFGISKQQLCVRTGKLSNDYSLTHPSSMYITEIN